MVYWKKSSVPQFGPRKQIPPRLRESKIMKMARKELRKTQENMRLGSRPAKQYPSKNSNVGPLEAKIVEKSNQVQHTSKNMKRPTDSSLKNLSVSSEKWKISTLSRSEADTNARLKKPHLSKKGQVLDISPPTHLKAMPKLAHKESIRLKEQTNFDRAEDIARKDGTKKPEFSKSIKFAISEGPSTPLASERKERHDEIVCAKEKGNGNTNESHATFGDHYKKEGNGNQHMQEHQKNSMHSSNTFGKGLLKRQRDNALCKEDGHSLSNINQRGLTEINFQLSNNRQAARCDGETNNGMSKKREGPLLKVNPKEIEYNGSEDVQGNNMDSRPMKKQRCVTSKGEDEVARNGGGDHNPMGVEDDVARTLSRATISKDGHLKASMPSVVEQRHHCCSKPIDKPNWSGIFNIDGKEYISLVGHLSTKSCEKVWSLSRQLGPLLELKRLPRSEVWPKAWEASKPNDNNIGMYFFPHNMRQDEDMDQVIKEVMENDLVLRAILGDVELLIFPSILLPDRHQTFQRKHYLWGLFKTRQDKGVAVAEPPSPTGCCAQEVEKEKQQHVSAEANSVKGLPNVGFDLKAPEEGTQAEAEATPVATDDALSLPNHGQIDPSMGLPVGRLMGFVVRQTPKLEQLIREMNREGALVFDMEGESLGSTSWPGNMVKQLSGS